MAQALAMYHRPTYRRNPAMCIILFTATTPFLGPPHTRFLCFRQRPLCVCGSGPAAAPSTAATTSSSQHYWVSKRGASDNALCQWLGRHGQPWAALGRARPCRCGDGNGGSAAPPLFSPLPVWFRCNQTSCPACLCLWGCVICNCAGLPALRSSRVQWLASGGRAGGVVAAGSGSWAPEPLARFLVRHRTTHHPGRSQAACKPVKQLRQVCVLAGVSAARSATGDRHP